VKFISVGLAALVAAALSHAPVLAQGARPVVATVQGQVSGVRQAGAEAFLGIPFARPPVGALRWREPMKLEPWRGVRDGSKFGANCYQAPAQRFGPYTPEFMIDASPVSEDCLYLNVWRPAGGGKDLPVLVWIHGGGFGGGSGSIPIYDGARLAAKGAVVVTINYRVGAFGFLAHPALSAESPLGTSGNYGLLDMIAALQWVRDNAARFGGDPVRVTVAGQSAGAMAINGLMLSPFAKGLFARAVAESGTAAGSVVIGRADAEREGQALATKLGASTAADLRRLPAQAVLDASGAGPPVAGAPPRPRLGPVVDGKVLPADPNDPTRPLSVNAPFLTGYNRDEGRGVTLGQASTPAAFEQAVRAGFGPFADRVLALYPHATDAEATASAALLPRDMVTTTLAAWAQARARVSGQRLYVYLFEHPYPGPEAAQFGTFHTAEVPYLFGVLDQQGRPFTDDDRRISDRVQAYWLKFMRSGDPNGQGLPAWPAARDGALEVMRLGDRFAAEPAASTPERLTLLREVVAAQGYAAFR
jgi:para-nitrobenzyl esterase